MRPLVTSKNVNWPRLICPTLYLWPRVTLIFDLLTQKLTVTCPYPVERLCIFGPKSAIQMRYYYYYYLL